MSNNPIVIEFQDVEYSFSGRIQPVRPADPAKDWKYKPGFVDVDCHYLATSAHVSISSDVKKEDIPAQSRRILDRIVAAGDLTEEQAGEFWAEHKDALIDLVKTGLTLV